jgi:hypothetical protein
MNEERIESVSRTHVSTMGDSVALVFNLEGTGELAVRIPYEVIADTQVALAHAQRALVFKRQALGASENPSLFHVASVRARDLPDSALHLQVNTENGIPFHFHVSREMAQAFAGALAQWLAPIKGP